MTESVKKLKRIAQILTVMVLVLLCSGAVLFAEDGSGEPDVTYAQSDTDFCMKVTDLCQGEQAQGSLEDTGDTGTDRRLLIVSDAELDLSGIEGLSEGVYGNNGLYVLQFDSAKAAKDAFELMQTWEEVQSVEFDAEVSTGFDAQPAEVSAAQTKGSGHLSWGAGSIGADTYSDYVSGISHRSVIVAVVDSGTDPDHPFYRSRLLPGYDFVENDNDPDDDFGHGTFTAGIVADCTAGINDIRIMPVKVLNHEGAGTKASIASGIIYASDNGAAVINMSLGGTHSGFNEAAVQVALDKGSLVVASAGNDQLDVDYYSICPAHIGSVLTVGAIDRDMTYADYSNYGRSLDVMAPGTDITSTWPGGKYATNSGTSAAAPHVSACAALIKSANPGFSYSRITSTIKRSCKWMSETFRYGSGIVNLNNLFTKISVQKLTLSSKSYEYTGKPIKAGLSLSRNGQKLFEGIDYTVSCKNNRKIGTATVVVRGKGTYSGSRTVKYKIVPVHTSIRKLTPLSRGFTVKWKKKTSQTSGYQIQYGTKKNFKGAKKATVKNKKTTSKKIKGLKAGKKYYVRVRTYKTVSGKKYYSPWSKVKTVKTK